MSFTIFLTRFRFTGQIAMLIFSGVHVFLPCINQLFIEISKHLIAIAFCHYFSFHHCHKKIVWLINTQHSYNTAYAFANHVIFFFLCLSFLLSFSKYFVFVLTTTAWCIQVFLWWNVTVFQTNIAIFKKIIVFHQLPKIENMRTIATKKVCFGAALLVVQWVIIVIIAICKTNLILFAMALKMSIIHATSFVVCYHDVEFTLNISQLLLHLLRCDIFGQSSRSNKIEF